MLYFQLIRNHKRYKNVKSLHGYFFFLTIIIQYQTLNLIISRYIDDINY